MITHSSQSVDVLDSVSNSLEWRGPCKRWDNGCNSKGLFTAVVPSQGDLAIANYREAVLVVTSCEVQEHYWR